MKPDYRLIAFTGAKRSGKSTASRALPKRFLAYSFASPIRSMLKVLGVPTENLDIPELKEEPIPGFGGRSARQLMQTLGTDWGRDLVSPTIWLDIARKDIGRSILIGQSVVIDDLRFDNEARLIHELGGIVVGVARPGALGDAHVSEAGVSPSLVDMTITNEADQAAFEAMVRKTLGGPK